MVRFLQDMMGHVVCDWSNWFSELLFPHVNLNSPGWGKAHLFPLQVLYHNLNVVWKRVTNGSSIGLSISLFVTPLSKKTLISSKYIFSLSILLSKVILVTLFWIIECIILVFSPKMLILGFSKSRGIKGAFYSSHSFKNIQNLSFEVNWTITGCCWWVVGWWAGRSDVNKPNLCPPSAKQNLFLQGLQDLFLGYVELDGEWMLKHPEVDVKVLFTLISAFFIAFLDPFSRPIVQR